MKKKIAIIVPVFNEAENLIALYERLEKVATTLASYHFEYFFVNDVVQIILLRF